MAIAQYDPTQPLADAYEAAFRALIKRMVEQELAPAGWTPNGWDLDYLVGTFGVPTGRSMVAKASPLKVESPASPLIPGPFRSAAFIVGVEASVFTAPTGAAITLQAYKRSPSQTDTALLTSPLSIPADGHESGLVPTGLLADYTIAPGDRLWFEVLSVGSGTKGELLTCTVWWIATALKRRGAGAA